MDNCVKCHNTGTLRTTILEENKYSFYAKPCDCIYKDKYKNPFENLKKEKERFEAIEKMSIHEVFQYIRDTIVGKDWSGGIKNIKNKEYELVLDDDCPF